MIEDAGFVWRHSFWIRAVCLCLWIEHFITFTILIYSTKTCFKIKEDFLPYGTFKPRMETCKYSRLHHSQEVWLVGLPLGQALGPEKHQGYNFINIGTFFKNSLFDIASPCSSDSINTFLWNTFCSQLLIHIWVYLVWVNDWMHQS